MVPSLDDELATLEDLLTNISNQNRVDLENLKQRVEEYEEP
jgi:hypothetical protein